MFQFRGVKEHIYGEESNKFTNVLGETIEISIQADVDATRDLLGMEGCILNYTVMKALF